MSIWRDLTVYFTDKSGGRNPAKAVAIFLAVMSLLIYYEVFKPEIYLESMTRNIVPYAVWIMPPIFFLAIAWDAILYTKKRRAMEQSNSQQ